MDAIGRPQDMLTLTEPGLYKRPGGLPQGTSAEVKLTAYMLVARRHLGGLLEVTDPVQDKREAGKKGGKAGGRGNKKQSKAYSAFPADADATADAPLAPLKKNDLKAVRALAKVPAETVRAHADACVASGKPAAAAPLVREHKRLSGQVGGQVGQVVVRSKTPT